MNKSACLASLLWAALLAVCPLLAEGQRSRGLTFGATQELTEQGLSFRVPRGASPDGLSQPRVYVYRYSNGTTLERFSPRDLWYPSVFLGRWADSSGVALVLGKLGPLPPEAVTAEHLSREEFQAAQSRDPGSTPMTWQELTDWLTFFVGTRAINEPRTVRTSPRLDEVVAIDFEPSNREAAAYLFRMAPNVHRIETDQWFVAVLEWPVDLDREAVLLSIERDFIGSLETIARTENDSGQATARLQHPELGARAETAQTATFQESRERAIQSIRGMPGWWFVETPNYVLVSDLSGGRRSFVQRLQEDLESIRSEYERIIPPRNPIDAVSLVRVFADGDEYKRYVGEEQQHTGGVWIPSNRELVIRSFDIRNELERRALIAQIVYHEAFHQYIYYAFDYLTPAAWYNEGHATFFEGADVRRGGIRVDEVERYVHTVEALAERGPLPVESVLALDYDTFYQRGGGSAAQRRAHYALSWGLVYYLRKGAPLEETNDYESILPRYEYALWRTQNPAQATKDAFSDVDLSEFIQSFTDFWGSGRRRHRARRNHDW